MKLTLRKYKKRSHKHKRNGKWKSLRNNISRIKKRKSKKQKRKKRFNKNLSVKKKGGQINVDDEIDIDGTKYKINNIGQLVETKKKSNIRLIQIYTPGGLTFASDVHVKNMTRVPGTPFFVYKTNIYKLEVSADKKTPIFKELGSVKSSSIDDLCTKVSEHVENMKRVPRTPFLIDKTSIYKLEVSDDGNTTFTELGSLNYCIPGLSEIKSKYVEQGENRMYNDKDKICTDEEIEGREIKLINYCFKLVPPPLVPPPPVPPPPLDEFWKTVNGQKMFKHGNGITWNILISELSKIKEENPLANTFIIGSHHALLRDWLFNFGEIDTEMRKNYSKSERGIDNCCCIHVKFTKNKEGNLETEVKVLYSKEIFFEDLLNKILEIKKKRYIEDSTFNPINYLFGLLREGYAEKLTEENKQKILDLWLKKDLSKIMIDEILLEPTYNMFFEKFLKSQFASENLDFWNKCNSLLLLLPDENKLFKDLDQNLKKKIEEIYETFVCDGSKQTVNLSSKQINNWNSLFEEETSSDSITRCLFKVETWSDTVKNLITNSMKQVTNGDENAGGLETDLLPRFQAKLSEKRNEFNQEKKNELNREQLSSEIHKYEKDNPDPFSSELQKHRKPLEITILIIHDTSQAITLEHLMSKKIATFFKIDPAYVQMNEISIENSKSPVARNYYFTIYTSLEKERQITLTLFNEKMNQKLKEELEEELKKPVKKQLSKTVKIFTVTSLTTKSYFFNWSYVVGKYVNIYTNEEYVGRYQNICTDEVYDTSSVLVFHKDDFKSMDGILPESKQLSLFFIRHGNAYHNSPCEINKSLENFVKNTLGSIRRKLSIRSISSGSDSDSESGSKSDHESELQKHNLDTPLTCLGMTQAIRLGIYLGNKSEKLNFPETLQEFKEQVVVVSGALQRAQHTALTVYNEILFQKFDEEGSEFFMNNYQEKSKERLKCITEKNKKKKLFDLTKPYYEHLNKDYNDRFNKVSKFVDGEMSILSS